jgi:cellulose biosynthesis protein BcsQ
MPVEIRRMQQAPGLRGDRRDQPGMGMAERRNGDPGQGVQVLPALREEREVMIDCCPFLGVLSLNAVFAADRLLVPISSDFLALRGALQVERTLQALEPVLKRRVERRYLLTRFDRRRNMSFEIQKRLTEQFGDEVCETVISENVAVAEAPACNLRHLQPCQAPRAARRTTPRWRTN